MSTTPVLQPNVTIALANADREVSNQEQRALIVGQQTASGSATEKVLVTNIASTGSPEDALFGENSMIAAMIRAFRLVNPTTRIDAIPLDDAGGGTARELTLTFVGNATAAGQFVVDVGSETLHRFTLDVASGDTITAQALALTNLINADTKCPFTAGAVVGVCTITAVNDGVVAKDLGVGYTGTVAGTVLTVAESVAGATDPTLTAILDVATARYQAVVWPYIDTSVLVAFLDARFNPANSIQDGVGFVTQNDSHANHLTALNLLNSPSLVYFCDKEFSAAAYIGPSLNEPSYSKSTMFAAVRALRLSPGASISRYLTSSSSLDQFGGTALASLPYFNTPIPQLPVVPAERGWTEAEIETLLTAGGSIMGTNSAGNAALVGEVATTYKTNSGGNPDVTWKFLNYVDTASNIREYFFNNFRNRFAQSRLTAGSVSRGRDMANSVIIRAYTEKLYQDLAGPDFILVQDGEEALVYFKNNLVIVLDLALGNVTLTMFTPIVTQLRQIIATIKIAFSTEA